MEQKFCYVGDVLGYKNIMINLPLADQLTRIEAWKNLINDGIKKFDLSEHIIVSDAVYVCAENNKGSLQKLLEFSKYMLTEGIKRCFPIRGAITFGDVVLDEEKNLVCGKAAANAYNLAEEQDWIGTCCEDNLPLVAHLWDFNLVFKYLAPMKREKVIPRPVISWNIPKYADLRRNTIGLGLTNESEDMEWFYANRIQNTIMLKWYLNGAMMKIIKANPSIFQADLPIEHIDKLINNLLFDANLRNSGFTLTRTPDGDPTYAIDRGPTTTIQNSQNK